MRHIALSYALSPRMKRIARLGVQNPCSTYIAKYVFLLCASDSFHFAMSAYCMVLFAALS
jgi:hypothetical protein